MQPIRNIAIIAHVDHGKTTLVDKIIDQAKILDDRKERTDLLLDNNDLERERGITILSKNVSVIYKGTKINVIDTPGHADFVPLYITETFLERIVIPLSRSKSLLSNSKSLRSLRSSKIFA